MNACCPVPNRPAGWEPDSMPTRSRLRLAPRPTASRTRARFTLLHPLLWSSDRLAHEAPLVFAGIGPGCGESATIWLPTPPSFLGVEETSSHQGGPSRAHDVNPGLATASLSGGTYPSIPLWNVVLGDAIAVDGLLGPTESSAAPTATRSSTAWTVGPVWHRCHSTTRSFRAGPYCSS